MFNSLVSCLTDSSLSSWIFLLTKVASKISPCNNMTSKYLCSVSMATVWNADQPSLEICTKLALNEPGLRTYLKPPIGVCSFNGKSMVVDKTINWPSKVMTVGAGERKFSHGALGSSCRLTSRCWTERAFDRLTGKNDI
uniref:Uncharacterized protein n=1 Tax=Romanomermis culicivorax TaxID=13658 RepID=A0A915L7R1_ROMCU